MSYASNTLTRSMNVYHLAGSACNNCDIEILDALTPKYDLERFGITLVGSIRHADVLLLSGVFNKKSAIRVRELIEQAPSFAETWNQRAIAHYRLRHFEDAANDCQQTLELNPYHFGAVVGMAHCYLELGEGFAALECFRRAIELNPNLEAVQEQIEYLERALKET